MFFKDTLTLLGIAFLVIPLAALCALVEFLRIAVLWPRGQWRRRRARLTPRR